MVRFSKLFLFIIVTLPFLYLAINWQNLKIPGPTGHSEPNKIDGQSLIIACIVHAIFVTGVYVSTALSLKSIPIRERKEKIIPLETLGILIVLFTSILLNVGIFATSNVTVLFSQKIAFALIGFVMSSIGYFFPALKPNGDAGIRIPWTLNDDKNWHLTHIFSGHLYFYAGLMVVMLALIVPAAFFYPVLISFILVTAVLVPVVYSFRLSVRKKHKGSN